MEELNQQAVSFALSGSWDEAVKINKKILKTNPNYIDALNRLAFAYQALGNIQKAKLTYGRVLKLDKYNNIAVKNLERLNLFKGKKKIATLKQAVNNRVDSFLEEPGKTKLISLVNLAPLSVISQLRPSQPIALCSKRKSIMVVDQNEKYVGALPDDLAFKLMRFLAAGYTYSGVIRSAEKNSVVVLIRELTRGKKYKNQPSFPAGNSDLEYVIIPPLDISEDPTLEEKKPVIPDDDFSDKEEPERENEEEN
ncbi:MAG: tetratricopeptide repeat protein [Patescibacteria group bacterium]|nr:tetratricopeptide repeat protein [Patescibacteria group bacterium]